MDIIQNHLANFNKALDHFKADIATLKTGRANATILDGVVVEAYGARTLLNQVGSISVPEARSIVVQPWDKSILKDVEKAIQESGLGLNPVNEGDKIRIVIPQMTEESRKEIVKILHQKIETARIALRAIRDEVRDEIQEAEKNKKFGEDEKFRQMEDLDKKTSGFNDQIKEIGEAKEKEIMTV
ncbi:MAG: ribosome recycling factor [Patescibacteria group bacterium]